MHVYIVQGHEFETIWAAAYWGCHLKKEIQNINIIIFDTNQVEYSTA